MAKTIDLELTRAEVEVLELEARLRVVPMNDTQLSDETLAVIRQGYESVREGHRQWEAVDKGMSAA